MSGANNAKIIDWAFPTVAHPDSSPGPIVKITQVDWWPNGSQAQFMKTMADGTSHPANQFCEVAKSCTASFINRSWLLTAAHCMQNVNKMPATLGGPCQNPSQPAPTPGHPNAQTGDSQDWKPGYGPHDSRTGTAKYVVSWPVIGDPGDYPTDDVPGIYSKQSDEYQAHYGVDLYQFPNEDYDPAQFHHPEEPEDEGIPTRRGPDVALLSMANWTSAAQYMAPDLDNEAAMHIAANLDEDFSGVTFLAAGYGVNPANNVDMLYGGALNKTLMTWRSGPQDLAADPLKYQSLGRFGGFGSVSVAPTSPADLVACSGDSGGPLYAVYTPEAGEPRKFIVYAVMSHTSHTGDQPAGGFPACPRPGLDTDYWSRLEADDRLIEWMNDVMAQSPVAKTEEEQKMYNQCQLTHDDVNGWYYKCWGAPCDGYEKGVSHYDQCPDGQSCVGSGKQLNDQNRVCYGCPGRTDKVNSCSCIVGYCMWDAAKLSVADTDDAGTDDDDSGPGGTP
jgi:hypothetical protein